MKFTHNIQQFKQATRQLGQRVFPQAVKDLHADLFGHAYSSTLLNTPVDTGHARHNWQPSISEEATEEIEGVFGGDAIGDPFTDEEISRGRRIQETLRKRPLGQVAYITNNVPYAQRLENGWSQQAPGGMAAVAVAEVLEVVKPPRVLDDSGS